MRVEVVAQQINVRVAPDGAIIGTLTRGALVDVTAISADRAWLYFRYWDKPAWITASPLYVRATSNLSQLGQLETQIALQQYSVVPDVPEPGEPFVIQLTLKAEQDLGAFKIAATCADFALLTVQRLAAGAAQTVDLHCPGDPATGPHNTQLVIDVDQQASQGSQQSLTYFIDRLYQQVTMNWPAFSDLNLDGLAYDLAYDGQQMRALHGAKFFSLDVDSLALIHYDKLTPIKTLDTAPAVGVIGVITAEGKRGALQVMVQQNGMVQIEFRVYEATHD